MLALTSMIASGCSKSETAGGAVYRRAVECWASVASLKAMQSSMVKTGIAESSSEMDEMLDSTMSGWSDRALAAGGSDGKTVEAINKDKRGELQKQTSPIISANSGDKIRDASLKQVELARRCAEEL